MTSNDERIVRLETKLDNHADDLSDVVVKLSELNTTVTSINRKLDKGMGFLAGAAFVFSLLGAALGAAGSIILKKVGLP